MAKEITARHARALGFEVTEAGIQAMPLDTQQYIKKLINNPAALQRYLNTFPPKKRKKIEDRLFVMKGVAEFGKRKPPKPVLRPEQKQTTSTTPEAVASARRRRPGTRVEPKVPASSTTTQQGTRRDRRFKDPLAPLVEQPVRLKKLQRPGEQQQDSVNNVTPKVVKKEVAEPSPAVPTKRKSIPTDKLEETVGAAQRKGHRDFKLKGKRLAAVTKEQLEESGLTLTEYLNKADRERSKRAKAKKAHGGMTKSKSRNGHTDFRGGGMIYNTAVKRG